MDTSRCRHLLGILLVVSGYAIWINYNSQLYAPTQPTCPSNEADGPSRALAVVSSGFARPDISVESSSILLSDDKTLTRIGDQLQFDYRKCPVDSVMTNVTRRATPSSHSGECPRLFIIGARKGGTTSLIRYLSEHPDFSSPNLNASYHAGETGYFAKNWKKKSWEWYREQFPKATVLGDSSVSNLVNCQVPKRIYDSCGGGSKIVVLLRNPLERLESNFRFRVHFGFRNYNDLSQILVFAASQYQSFYATVLKHKLTMRDPVEDPNKALCLFSASSNGIYEGLYIIHLQNWLCNYPAENIMIISSEEFFADTAKVVNQVTRFIGLSAIPNLTRNVKQKYNANPDLDQEPDHRKLSPALTKQLKTIYRPYNSGVLKLLDWPVLLWET